MRRALIFAALSAVLACGPTHFELPLMLSPEERLVVVILDESNTPVQALLVGPESEAIEADLEEGWSIVRARFSRDDFLTADGTPVSDEMLAQLALSAEPGPREIRSSLGCSRGWAAAPQLVHPGDVCPLPARLELERERSTPDGVKTEPLGDDERKAIAEGVRLSWPGSSNCSEGLENNQAPPRPTLVYEIESPLPKRPGSYRHVGNSAEGRIAVGYEKKLALVSPEAGTYTTTSAETIAAVLGLDGEQFLIATVAEGTGQVELQLFDERLRPRASLAISRSDVRYARLQRFVADPRIILSTQDQLGTLELHVCERIQPAPGLTCASVLRLDRPFDPISEDSAMLFANGTFIWSSSGLQLLSLERLPRPGELSGPTVSSASNGTIASGGGPVSWRLDRVRVVRSNGSELPLAPVEGAIRTMAWQNQAVACVAVGTSDDSFIATASISADFIARGEEPPPFQVALGLGPYVPHCRPAPVAPGASQLRVNFTYGSAIDVDVDMNVLACIGPVCDQPGDTPTKAPLGSAFRVLTQAPGWSVGTIDTSSQIYRRLDSAGPSFELVYEGRVSWFGAMAARDRELWAFHTGRGSVDRNALARLDPPIHAPPACTGDEIPVEAALDHVRDELVLIGTTRGTLQGFVRRVELDETVRDIPIPPALASAGWPSSLAELRPGRFLIATSAGQLWLLEGDTLSDLPIRDWDDHTTGAIETKPEDCTETGPSYAYGKSPLFRSVRAVQGVAVLGGCRALSMMVWLHGDQAEIDVLDPAVGALQRDDVSETVGVCANQLYSASVGTLLRGEAPYERPGLEPLFGHGYALSVVEASEIKVVKLLASAERLLILRAENDSGSIRIMGGVEESTFPSRFVTAAEASDGTVLISTADDQLLIAR